MKDAEAHADEDKQRREEADVRNSGDSLVYQTEKFLKDNADKEDEAMNVFHFTSIQDESIIVDAINFVISYQDNVDEWKTFLGSTPEDLDTMDIKLAPGIGSKLHTFPADVSPLIYDLTRRLEALQAW